MILDRAYDRNSKTGEIKASETLAIRCDRCPAEWSALCKHYRRNKKISQESLDLCVACRNRAGMNGLKGRGVRPELLEAKKRGVRSPSIKIVSCDFCGASFPRHENQIGAAVFCGNRCRAEHGTLIRFNGFLEIYQRRDDEIAYLVGMILGDGSIMHRVPTSSTARIQVSCDAAKTEVISQLEETLRGLSIPYGNSPNRESCRVISFSLPSSALPDLGLDFMGEKYLAQPTPAERYATNPNLIVGLINSDGYVADRLERGARIVRFASTVSSIFESAKNCLRENGVTFYEGWYEPRHEGWKKNWWLSIERPEDVEKLYSLVSLEIQPAKQIK